MKKIFSRKILDYTIVLTIFTILAIIFTYPLVCNFSTSTSGWQSMNDSELFLWNFWWVKHAIFDLKSNPFYTHYLYYPQQVSLTLHTLTLFPALISSIFQFFTQNIIIVYNLLFLLTFTFSGFGTYLLINYLYKNKLVAYISGVAFAFCPYVFAHVYAGHFNLMNTWTIPFYLYFFFRMLDRKKTIDIILASLIVTIQIYTDFHYLLFMFIISLIVLAYYIFITKKFTLIDFKNSFYMVMIIILLSIPLFVPTYQFSKVYNAYQAARLDYTPATEYTDLSHYLLGPDYQNKLLVSDEKRDDMERNYQGGIRENNIFFGYTVIILAFFGLILVSPKQKWLFFVIGLIFFILSLGFYLYWQKEQIIDVKLPAYYISQYILKNSDLVFSRFSVVTILMLIVLAAGFLSRMVKRNKQAVKIILPIFLVLIIIEFINAPILLTKYQSSDYLNELANDPTDFRIITLPNNLYYQIIINKPQLVGALGRRAHDYYQDNGHYKDIPGIRLFYSVNNSAIVPNDDDRNQQILSDQFKKYNVKYIILEKKQTPPAEVIKYRNISENIMQLNIYFEDSDIVVYKTL